MIFLVVLFNNTEQDYSGIKQKSLEEFEKLLLLLLARSFKVNLNGMGSELIMSAWGGFCRYVVSCTLFLQQLHGGNQLLVIMLWFIVRCSMDLHILVQNDSFQTFNMFSIIFAMLIYVITLYFLRFFFSLF